MLALRQFAESRAEQMREAERLNDVDARRVLRAMQSADESQDPVDDLVRPWTNAVGHEVEGMFSRGGVSRLVVDGDPTGARRSDAGETAEERRLTGPVWADETEDLSC